MDCWAHDDLSVHSNRLLSDNTLHEKKSRLESESREQCFFCMLFTAASVGSAVGTASSHGATLPSTVPAMVVSTSSAAVCFNECTTKRRDIGAIDEELARRKEAKVRYIDNLRSLSVYSTTDDTLHRVHYPIL